MSIAIANRFVERTYSHTLASPTDSISATYPETPMAADSHLIASVWLSKLACALRSGDAAAVTALFLADGWLRDILVLTWDLRTLEGQDKIATYLSGSLKVGQITDVRLDDIPRLAPRICKVPLTNDMFSVGFGFKFELPHGHGRGLVRLVEDSAGGTYRAFTVLLTLEDIRGHEELTRLPLRDDVTGLSGRDMEREVAEWVRQVETNPYVLIGNAACVHIPPKFILTIIYFVWM